MKSEESEIFLQTSRAKVYCRSIGAGMPVVLLSGFLLDHRALWGCMEPIFRKHQGFHRYYVDLPAMGKSQEVRGLKSSGHILQAVIECLPKLVGGKSFLVVGYSYGDYLAQCLAVRVPKCIDGMLLIAPVVFPETEERTLPKKQVLIDDCRLQNEKDQVESELFDALVLRTDDIWERVRKQMLPGMKLANRELLDELRSCAYRVSCNTTRMKSKFRKPVLFLAGKQDHIVGFKDLLQVLDNYPSAAVSILDRAGHNLPYEQPVVFGDLVGDWLEGNWRHEGSSVR